MADAGISKKKETDFHEKLDKLMHKTFGRSPSEKKETAVKEGKTMIGFKNYLTEAHLAKHTDEESEFEGLSDIFSHAMNLDTLSPEMHSMLTKNVGGLNEAAEEHSVSKLHRDMKALHERHESSDGYGKKMGAPLSLADAANTAKTAVREHYKKSPEEQSASLAEHASKYGHTRWGAKGMSADDVAKRIRTDSGNTKTGMNVKHPLVNRDLGNGKTASVNTNLGFGGSPVFSRHFHDSSMAKSSTVKACHDMTKDCGVGHTIRGKDGDTTKINPSCLAQSGGYKFANTISKLATEDHIRHGSETTVSHALLTAHALKTSAEVAMKKGRVVDVRHQVSDQKGEYTRGISHEVKEAHPHLRPHLHDYDYNKDYSQVLSALRDKKAGRENISGTFSHTGPTYHMDAQGTRHINKENLESHGKFYTALETADKEGLDHRSYLVRGGRNIHPDGKPFGNDEAGSAHRQPKSNAKGPEATSYKNTDAVHQHTRYYATLPEHGVRYAADHEPDESFDEKSGTGHTTIKQADKRVVIPFKQHKTNHVEGHGWVSPAERSDGAAGGIGHSRTQASSSVASASNTAVYGEHADSLMHQTHDSTVLDRGTGILHVANPHVMSALGHTYKVKEDQKKVIPITPVKEESEVSKYLSKTAKRI